MKLQDTIKMMNSEDFKERFRAEYFQLQNRIEGLSDMLEKYRAGTLTFTPKCSIKILDAQLMAMITYRTHLTVRADIEGISLTEPGLTPNDKSKVQDTKNHKNEEEK